jgi:bla regulator protein blaR1
MSRHDTSFHTRYRRWLGGAALLLVCACTLPTLLAGGNDVSRLLDAVRANRPDLVRQLVAQGVDINATQPGDGSALIVASRRGNLAMVDALIALGADVDRASHGDGTPLIAAAGAGQVAVIERLSAKGANIDFVAADDETALISAVRGNHAQAVESLIRHGADVNLGVLANGTQWRTPLNQAHDTGIHNYLADRGATRDGTRRR